MDAGAAAAAAAVLMDLPDRGQERGTGFCPLSLDRPPRPQGGQGVRQRRSGRTPFLGRPEIRPISAADRPGCRCLAVGDSSG